MALTESSSGPRRAHRFLVLLIVFSALQTMETTTSVTLQNETLSQQDQQIPQPTVSDEPRQYVVLSANVGRKARLEDYDYLAALTARNWNNFGFTPIIVIVASTVEEISRTVDLWNIILPHDTIIIPVLVKRPQHQISVAQVSRLFAVSSLADLRDEDFVRITDADMMILNPIPFEPPDDNTTDITIFNGNCCRRQYPMHSVGMKVRLFRAIFPIDHAQRLPSLAGSAILSQFYNWTETRFPKLSGQVAMMKHGGQNWGMDQQLLTEKINAAVQRHGYKLKKEPGPRGRLHNRKNPFSVVVTDAHLASFSLSRNGQWLDGVVNNTVVLYGNRQKYFKYTQAWKDHKLQIMQNQTTNSTAGNI